MNAPSSPAAAPRPYADLASAVLRVGTGLAFAVHGFPKISGGPDGWMQLGQAIGLPAGPAALALGAGAAGAEFFGGLLLAAGLYTRPAATLLLAVMGGATVAMLNGGGDFNAVSHPGKLLFVFGFFALAGADRFSADQWRRQR